jgi:endonuclease YncB( thermonuclease family)
MEPSFPMYERFKTEEFSKVQRPLLPKLLLSILDVGIVLLACTVLFLLVALLLPTKSNAADTVIPVMPDQITVYDGDTFTVNTGETEYKIRLEHIDAPEKYQEYGKEAKLYLENLLGKDVVYIKVDLEAERSYKRIIGTVKTSDEIDVSKELVRQGLAWWYRKYSDDPSYENLELTARLQKLGVWNQDYPIAPWMYRKGIKQEHLEPYFIFRRLKP